jgi:hypothetical protein
MAGFSRRIASRKRPGGTTSSNESRSVPDRVTQLAKPFEGGLFDDGFGEAIS